MYPVLLQLGPFALRTLSVFFILAFFTTAFLFWRKIREEHYPEDQVFDGFLLSALVGFIAGRFGYIASQFDIFGIDLIKWIDIATYPGINGAVSVLAAALFLYRYARKKKWDVFEILDFWVLGLAGGLAIVYVGLFFDGTGFGTATELPWGIVFPGLQEPHHPIQLYYAAFYLVLSWYLAMVEYSYRSFTWYRAGRKTANAGFLVSVFFIASAVFYFGMSWVKMPIFTFFDLNIDRLVALLAIVLGVLLLFFRSGRSFRQQRASKDIVQEILANPDQNSDDTPPSSTI
ncbi:MAG: prolipoprotein diacylglyceryl transferase family protein [Patescibacteria group bacterium]